MDMLKLEVLEPAPGAFRVRSAGAGPRDYVAVWKLRTANHPDGIWVCEAHLEAWERKPCEHIKTCMDMLREARP